MLNSVLLSLNSFHNGNPIDNSILPGHCKKEFPPTCTTMRVRLRGKKQNLEKITIFMDWNGGMWDPYIFNWKGDNFNFKQLHPSFVVYVGTNLRILSKFVSAHTQR